MGQPVIDNELLELLEKLPKFSFSGIQKKKLIYPSKFKPNGSGIKLICDFNSIYRPGRQQLFAYVDLYEAKLARQHKGCEELLSDKRLSEHIIMTSDKDKYFKPIIKEMIQNGDGNYESELSSFELIKTSGKGENKRKTLKRKYEALQEHVGYLGNDLTAEEVNVRINNSVSVHMGSSQNYDYVCYGVHICRMNNGKFERVNGPFYSDPLAMLN